MKTQAPHRPFAPVAQPAEPGRSPRDWFRAWDRFWFRPSDPTVLGLIRLCTGLVLVYSQLMFSFDLQSYVGAEAWVDDGPGGAAHTLRYELPFVTLPTGWQVTDPADLVIGRGHYFWSVFYHVHDPRWVYAVHFGILAIMVLFTVGLWTRITSVLAWAGGMCYLQRAPTLLFGMDTMSNLLLLYLMIGPCGEALSVDAWLRRRRERAAGLGDLPPRPSATATLATRLLQINFCFIYMGSGTSKLLGSAWWNGTAVWGTMANSYFAPLNQAWYASWLQWLASHRVVWEISMTSFCVFTLFLEIGLPFLIWNRRWRWLMVCGAVMLHTGIGVFMGLVTFSLCMLCMVLSFVPPEAVRDLLERVSAAWRRSAVVEEPVRASAGSLALSRR